MIKRIGIAGKSCSGKTTAVEYVKKKVQEIYIRYFVLGTFFFYDTDMFGYNKGNDPKKWVIYNSIVKEINRCYQMVVAAIHPRLMDDKCFFDEIWTIRLTFDEWKSNVQKRIDENKHSNKKSEKEFMESTESEYEEWYFKEKYHQENQLKIQYKEMGRQELYSNLDLLIADIFKNIESQMKSKDKVIITDTQNEFYKKGGNDVVTQDQPTDKEEAESAFLAKLTDKGEILTTRKDGKYHLPGGKGNLGESTTNTLRREIQEELKGESLLPLVEKAIKQGAVHVNKLNVPEIDKIWNQHFFEVISNDILEAGSNEVKEISNESLSKLNSNREGNTYALNAYLDYKKDIIEESDKILGQ